MKNLMLALSLLFLLVACAADSPVTTVPAEVAVVKTAIFTTIPAAPATASPIIVLTFTPTTIPVTALPTLPPAPSATASPTPLPTIAPTPITPATVPPAIWTTIGTPMSSVQAVLSPENVTQIQELGRWGKGRVIDAVYSPDGTQLIVATALGVYVYDAETAVQLSFIPVENIQLASMAVSPDGQLVAMGIAPNQIEVRRLSDGSLQNTFTAPSGIGALRFTNDGQHLLAPYAAWRMTDGVSIPNAYDMSMLSDDGKTVALYIDRTYEIAELIVDNEVTLLKTGVVIPTEFYTEFYHHIKGSLSPDGQFLAFGSDYTVEVYQVSDGALLRTLENPVDYEVMGLEFAPNSQTLAAIGFWKTSLWQVSDGQLLRQIPDAYGNITFSSDGTKMASWSDTLTQWDVSSGAHLNQLKQHAGRVEDLSFTSTSSHLAIASNNLYFRRVTDGGLLTSLPNKTQHAEITPDDQTIVYISGDKMSFYDLSIGSSFSVTVPVGGHTQRVDGFGLSADGKMAGVTSNFNGVEIRGISDGYLLDSGYTLSGQDVTFSPVKPLFATYGLVHTELWLSPPVLSGTVESDESYTPQPEREAVRSFDSLGGGSSLSSLAFSPDGTLLTAGFSNGIIILWRVSDGALVATLQSQSGRIAELNFSPDGKLLASASFWGYINLWRVDDGVLLHTLYSPNQWLSVEFSPNGRLLATGSGDGLVRLWGVP